MSVTVVVGAQWGDEGKGKITDFLAADVAVVARAQGGSNAGHTVVFDGQEYKLHLLPSGILRSDVLAIAGAGMVIDPEQLLNELEQLPVERGELLLDERAHIVMPYHKLLDAAEEKAKGSGAAGTTGRGIGPAYGDRATRFGIRVGDLLEPETLRERLARVVPRTQALLAHYGATEQLDEQALFTLASGWGSVLADSIGNASLEIAGRLDQGVLLEGAQGVHIDIDHGIYPFVTSSSPTPAGMAQGVGVAPQHLSRIVGVVKGYTTRVGTGPFPTELQDATGDYLRQQGNEFGTTTGRPRRCGWLDLVMLEHSQRLCGFSELAFTKLDVMGGLDKIRVCTAYESPQGRLEHFPASMTSLAQCTPVYQDFPGWPALSGPEWLAVAESGELPSSLSTYLAFICKQLGVPAGLLSLGPERETTLRLL
ncbi:MAG: adenylosuccinate synthase [Candidatus Thermoplasmatota archaeon]|nr:adenylosuccinate synthase [Candidatus Thermoplasmatota archaeon]